jgi:aminopeptidase N
MSGLISPTTKDPMRTEQARPIHLSDYRPSDWLIDKVEFDVSLHATATRVRAVLDLRPNPQGVAGAPLVLDGEELNLVAVTLDNAPLAGERYAATPDGLTISEPPRRPFRLEIETLIDPSANTQLMGLYRSGETYCTQCEAQGFRRITYFLDRPDVMAVYTTRIEAERAEAPVLLANGNLVAAGDVAGTGRHFAVWHDPFPKPSYLFALVGGRLGSVEDRFRTMSGRDVALRIYVEPGKEERCAWAMESLKRAMRWDEEAFGREYDLEVFMIVAVSDFNMGAMENKGLNVFNDKLVLASPQTATDADHVSIEAVIAHEYFHNWTGNRITCRDWFQLCLKEGLTVFRDEEFTSDLRSRAVERIGDVRGLRAHQFVEDAGPLAHPVRPETYHEINNFYTPTVYEKGAAVVRMLKVLLGADGFRHGMDLYFERHDGRAATVEEFVACFAETNAIDLTQFMLWYSQAGTPELNVTGNWDVASRTYRLDVLQMVPPTPGQPVKQPMMIPFVVGLVGSDGRDLDLILAEGRKVERGVLTLARAAETFVFKGVAQRPVASLNRGFSAPVNLIANLDDEDLGFLAARDSDPFNRWQAVNTLATRLLVRSTAAIRRGEEPLQDPGLLAAFGAALSDRLLEPAFVAQTITLPSETDIAREIAHEVDPDAVFAARRALRCAIAASLGDSLTETYQRLAVPASYSPDAESAGRRSLKNACLDLLTEPADRAAIARAQYQYESADNMTDRMAALHAMLPHAVPERTAALIDFYRRFESNPLVIDKWFALHATIPEPATLDRLRVLASHAAFSLVNPNRVRSLIGTFAQLNQTQFNRVDGQGYDFVIDKVREIDVANPQVAARLLGAFKSWRALEPARRAQAEAALKRLAAGETMSRDVADIASRCLGDV